MHCSPCRSLPPHVRLPKLTSKPELHVSNALCAISHTTCRHDLGAASTSDGFTVLPSGTKERSPRSWATVSVRHVAPTSGCIGLSRTVARLWSDSPSFRLYSTLGVTIPQGLSPSWEDDPEALNKAMHRKRRAEWKRRQGGSSFRDHVILTIQAGKGGDGAVAFNREKFVPIGPPSGGNGGQGGSVFLRANPSIASLAGLPKKVIAPSGENGLGSWRHGRKVEDTIIDVPVGTVVRELREVREREDLRGRERWDALSEEDKIVKERDALWVHYPRWKEENESSSKTFLQAEQAIAREERTRKREVMRRLEAPVLLLDLDKPDADFIDPAIVKDPSGVADARGGVLIARGGQGGLGNPHFASSINRSPKFATRGKPGEQITLSLELKLLADVGLVGFPNAGKSTMLRAISNSKTEVASYAFTTLNPQVGVVRVWDDGTFGDNPMDNLSPGSEHAASLNEGVASRIEGYQNMDRETRAQLGVYWFRSDSIRPTRVSLISNEHIPELDGSRSPTTSQPSTRSSLRMEVMRFTVADNPGLIAGASGNIGLGHSFLRSIERSLALVYVVDFSRDAPWEDVETLRSELEAYKKGLSHKACLIVANKADLAASTSSAEDVRAANEKLMRLEAHAEYMAIAARNGVASEGNGVRNDTRLHVIPVSGKYRENLDPVVWMLSELIKRVRDSSSQRHALQGAANSAVRLHRWL